MSNINLRLINKKDALFIIELRNSRGQFLSEIDNDLQKQEQWILDYKEREKKGEEFYFIIESLEGEKLGSIRIYNFKQGSFCWGSWIIKETAPYSTALRSSLAIYDFAFNTLGFSKACFQVDKQNKRVINFHKKTGANIVNENKKEYFFNYFLESYKKYKDKYKKYNSTNSITINPLLLLNLVTVNYDNQLNNL
jgi:RimJ/RimL family protein N-acetyltransferase